MRNIKDAALAFDRACSEAGVPYALIGGFAVMAWGEPRATMDVDALVRLQVETLDRFLGSLSKEHFKAAQADLEDAVNGEGHATVFDLESAYHIDVKAARTELERSQVADAVKVSFGSGSLRVSRPEDTVAYKLLFGSEQDVKDARSILVRAGGRLDRTRLRELATRLGVATRLAELEHETGLA